VVFKGSSPDIELTNTCHTIGFFAFRKYKTGSLAFKRSVCLAAAYWLINFLFIMTLHLMVSRYAIQIMLFDIAFGLCLVEHIYRDDKVYKENNSI
jgi:hypothetical protein